ncbi:xylulokinase [Gaoshiqia sp. Z1-71]|uniref:xylulokinase n=1 Tax=Gaoshiqia hydrogeniformans TaxID=3290090 RepID=UPI003BF8B3D0
MYLLGFDIGSSSVKASIINGESGQCLASAFYPKQEMRIKAVQSGWAEQEPEQWWENLKLAVAEIMDKTAVKPAEIDSIGISYQMHGLVLVDKNQQVLRPSIIWCDSRATEIGEKAFQEIGQQACLENLLNSPGNFTASKLKWVKDHEPELYARIDKMMLPGDYIAMKLTGEVKTTASGLSEGILWNFKENKPAKLLLDHYGFDESFIPQIVPTFSVQGELSETAARELRLAKGIKISYRAGDQPNNALSLNVLKPGEIATTAGTSGVVYGVSDEIKFDPQSRVNTFAHVNHTAGANRLGVLLCINGTGILNSWLNKQIGGGMISYEEMNKLAAGIPIGANGLRILPFGNGAERVLENKNPGSTLTGINFNIHTNAHLFRAAQEGIVFAFKYGMDIMKTIGIDAKVIRAGKANMFLSPIFRETLAGITGATIELYNTDGSIGAARGAGIGSGYYQSENEAFDNLTRLELIEPDNSRTAEYTEAYDHWKTGLEKILV